MKKKTDWDNFSKEKEIAQMTAHLLRHWEGLQPEKMQTLVTIAFNSGWDNTGEYFDKYTIQGEHASPIRLVSQRRTKMKELGFDIGAILDDSVSNILYSFESLLDHVQPPVSFSQAYPALKKAVLAAVGKEASRARPIGWFTQTDTTESDRESLAKAYDDFDGVAVNNAAATHFVEATRFGYVKYMTAEKGRTKLETLLTSIYAHAHLVRAQYNNEMMGRGVASVDIHQKSTQLGEKVSVPTSQPFRRIVERTALVDPSVAEGLTLVTWEEPRRGVDATSDTLGM